LRQRHDRGSYISRGIGIDRETKVIPNGFRLVVRLDDNVHAMLNAKGEKRSLTRLEVDQVCANGATIQDIINFREALPKSRVWSVVANEMQNRFPLYQTSEGAPASAYVTLKLVSFTLAEAVFEIGADISDGDY
jgi:hypothetical protein